jgi:hypothetical protein
MKTFSLFILLLSVSPAYALFQGGVSGGGGNLISPLAPNKPGAPSVAANIIYSSKAKLENYVQQKRRQFELNQLSDSQRQAFAPIFNSKQSIEKLMKNVQVRIADQHSCWDPDRGDVDGSTVSSTANTICISAYRFAKEDAVADMAPQSVALMLHEYGELVGLNEDQAIQAQAAALQELRGF